MPVIIFTVALIAAIAESEILSLGLLVVAAFYGLYKLCEVMAKSNFKF